MVQELAAATLIALGIDVIDAGLSTTPTIEMAIQFEKAAGGMIVSASHNPKEWNALKLFNHLGEFISTEDGKQVLSIAEKNEFNFASVDKLGNKTFDDTFIQKHIQAIVDYDLVDVQAIKKRKFKIVIDAINSSGAIAVPALLQALGVKDSDIVVLNSEVTGKFAHNPEPLPEHLQELCNAVNKHKADIGIAV
jgi:phosphomannomutase